MKWKQAKFNIITNEGIKEVEGKVTTFYYFDYAIKIGVFSIYQLTQSEFDLNTYSITELTTGRLISTCGSLGSATRYLNLTIDKSFCEKLKNELKEKKTH